LYSTFLSAGVALTRSIASSAATAKGEVERETHCSKSDGVEVGSYVQQQKHKEIVAGSVIGGVMVLVIVILAIGIFVSWRRKLKGEVRGKWTISWSWERWGVGGILKKRRGGLLEGGNLYLDLLLKGSMSSSSSVLRRWPL
jgi:hypothetical protein